VTVAFNNDYLERLFEGKPLVGKPKFSMEVITKFKKTVLMLTYADSISDIRKLRGLNFESLKGKLKGYYSVRVDKQYRLVLSIEKDTLSIDDILLIEELSNHYE
jgi:proteic killer suppression protein